MCFKTSQVAAPQCILFRNVSFNFSTLLYIAIIQAMLPAVIYRCRISWGRNTVETCAGRCQYLAAHISTGEPSGEMARIYIVGDDQQHLTVVVILSQSK